MTYGVVPPVGFGLQPRVSLTGGAWNNQQNAYQIVSGYNTSIFTGDPVSIGADGTIKQGPDANGLFAGVFVGCEFNITVPNAAGNVVFSPFWPANQPTVAGSTITAFIIDDPTVEFSVQFGGVADATNLFIQAYIGQNFPFNTASYGLGNTLTGQSGVYLSTTAAANTGGTPNQVAPATASFKIVRFEPSVSQLQVIGNPYINVVGVLNKDTYKGTTTNPA